MGKRTELYDPLNHNQKTKVPLVKPPFRISYFCNEIFQRKSKYGIPEAAKRMELMFHEADRRVPMARYALLMLQVGSELQRSLEILQTKRILDIGNLYKSVEFKDHPLVSSDIFPNQIAIGRRDSSSITEQTFLTWQSVLTDLIFQLSEHLQHFSVYVESRRIPSFSELRPKTSTQE